MTASLFVNPTPTNWTLSISSSILIRDLPLIFEISFTVTVVEPIPTACERPILTSFLATGLWIILSTVIIALEVATSLGTAKLCVDPIPVIESKSTDVPAVASDDPIASLNWSSVILIAKTSLGNLSVAAMPIPGELVVLIPIVVPVFCELLVGEYISLSPVLKLCRGIVIVFVDVSIAAGSKVW